MAKMFYTLEEAAEKLGKTQDEVKELVTAGKLQQFRDRDKLMFKRDQVDALVGDADDSGAPVPTGSGMANNADGAEPDAKDALNLEEETQKDDKPEDARKATGVSVFDTDEVEPVDPSAQTQVTANVSEEEELALSGVGSGSGLLDLTRESDDTSLGAELLDEIRPGGVAGEKDIEVPAPGSAPVDASDATAEATAIGAEATTFAGEASSTSFEEGSGSEVAAPTLSPVGYVPEAYDPAWSAATSGAFFGVTVALSLGFVVFAATLMGGTSPVTRFMIQGNTNKPDDQWIFITMAVLLGVSLLFGLGGMLLNRRK